MTEGAPIAAWLETRRPPSQLPGSFSDSRIAQKMIPAKTHKRCARCREWLPFSAFRPNKKLKSGLNSWCKNCGLQATQAWRERNRDQINAARREAYGSSNPHRYPKIRASARKMA
jgi:hypothetical protein